MNPCNWRAIAAVCGCLMASSASAYDLPPIHFAKGASQATVSGAVIRGDRNVYHFDAKAGQTLSLRISSAENNAVLTVYAPGTAYKADEDGILDFTGEAIAGDTDDITHWSGRLPQSGTYLIVIGGTRGNASYKLAVAIR